MHYILLAFLFSVRTGDPISYERVGAPFETPEACVQAQANQPIQNAIDGRVKAFVCVREDQLREVTT